MSEISDHEENLRNTMGALGLLSMMELLPCMRFHSALEHKQHKANWSRT